MKSLCNGLMGSAVLGAIYLHSPAAESADHERTVYSFCSQSNCYDGINPNGQIVVNRTLYGTTATGGGYNAGTLYSIDPSTHAETVLHDFGPRDGSFPTAGLVDVNGTLYGTTYQAAAVTAARSFRSTRAPARRRSFIPFATGARTASTPTPLSSR
jgi:uncharacterized repeat protein (TIGR03803 family)